MNNNDLGNSCLNICGKCSLFVTATKEVRYNTVGKCHLNPGYVTTVEENGFTSNVVFPYVGYHQLGCSHFRNDTNQVRYDTKEKRYVQVGNM